MYVLLTGGAWVNSLREFRTVGSGPVLSNCRFNDTQLVECTRPQFGDCNHLQDVGIRCLGKHHSSYLVFVEGGSKL